MMVIGLTGGIGMGKSTVAGMFAACGIPSFNADDAVRALQAPGGRAIAPLAAAFAGVVKKGVLDRATLRRLVLKDAAALRRLEGIMHPLVHQEEALFRARAFRAGRRAVVLDIPLLFETGAEVRADVTVTVSAPFETQVERVRARGLADDEIFAIIAKQLPDAQRRRRADYVINTGLSLFHTRQEVRRLVKRILP
jgi:dephospho-CoA kinase